MALKPLSESVPLAAYIVVLLVDRRILIVAIGKIVQLGCIVAILSFAFVCNITMVVSCVRGSTQDMISKRRVSTGAQSCLI
jgi:hypothetical protein